MGPRAQRRSLTDMTENDLRRALLAAADRDVPSTTRLATDVLTLAALRSRGRPTRRPRLRLALVGAVALVALTAAGALAVASGTLPVQFNLIDPGPANHGKSGVIDAPAAASLDAAKRAAAGNAANETPDPSALAAKLAAAEAERNAANETPDSSAAAAKRAAADAPAKHGSGATTMSLTDAEAAFGTHVLVPPTTAPIAVLFESAASQSTQTKPGAPTPHDTLQLKYSVDGADVSITEERDDSTTPLTVDVLNEGGPTLKTNGGLGRAAIEAVNGGSYVVGYAVDDTNVVWVIFKSTTGVDVTIHFEPGIAHDAALAFATSLQ
jgi:hypothetical protein